MSDVEHRLAVYRDAAGTWKTIHFEKLEIDKTFSDAKLLELYDESEQVRVYPREGTGGRRRHFYSESRGLRGLDRGERNLEHDRRVSQIFESLKELSGGWKLAYQSVASADSVNLYGPLPAYTWGTEVQRILSADTSVRHDVYGDWGIRMSTQVPSIAIEVVNTHFPEESTFSEFLARSKAVPFVVLFDFTRINRNALVVVDKDKQMVLFRSYTFLIKEGTVWLGDDPKNEIKTSAHLKVAVEKRYQDWR